MFELIKDPKLFQRVRDEVLTALSEDPGELQWSQNAAPPPQLLDLCRIS